MPARKRQPVTEALAARRQELVDYARRRVGPAAEDVVQDASLRALKKAEQLSNPRSESVAVHHRAPGHRRTS